MAKLPFKSLGSPASAKFRRAAGNTPSLLDTTTPAPPGGTPGQPGGADYGAPLRSIKQVNALIQQVLAKHLPAFFCVMGEISNFRVYDRGHAFFTLKEPGAELPCVCWKDTLAQLGFKPRDGMAVIARGTIKLYEAQGRVQLYVEALYPQGTGALELAFRQLCQKLKGEGLFEAARKHPICRLPQRVVIVTSRSGDVLHDVLTTAYRRFPGLHTMLYPVPVQGPTAAGRIVEALKSINTHAAMLGGVDLILLVRGGGSLEDLWPFNEESVARAIVASKIPIATGIGHEPDTTIADLVGDLCGPTPTGVTELTIPDVRVLQNEVAAHYDHLTREMRRQHDMADAQVRRTILELAGATRQTLRHGQSQVEFLARQIAHIEPRHAIAQGWRRIEEAQRKIAHAQQQRLHLAHKQLDHQALKLRLASPAPRAKQAAGQVDRLQHQLACALRIRLGNAQRQLSATESQLRIVSPQAVLERGFSITRDAHGNIIRQTTQVTTGDTITTHVADGQFKSIVGTPKQGRLF